VVILRHAVGEKQLKKKNAFVVGRKISLLREKLMERNKEQITKCEVGRGTF